MWFTPPRLINLWSEFTYEAEVIKILKYKSQIIFRVTHVEEKMFTSECIFTLDKTVFMATIELMRDDILPAVDTSW